VIERCENGAATEGFASWIFFLCKIPFASPKEIVLPRDLSVQSGGFSSYSDVPRRMTAKEGR
jgi:hypothetical protein